MVGVVVEVGYGVLVAVVVEVGVWCAGYRSGGGWGIVPSGVLNRFTN